MFLFLFFFVARSAGPALALSTILVLSSLTFLERDRRSMMTNGIQKQDSDNVPAAFCYDINQYRQNLICISFSLAT